MRRLNVIFNTTTALSSEPFLCNRSTAVPLPRPSLWPVNYEGAMLTGHLQPLSGLALVHRLIDFATEEVDPELLLPRRLPGASAALTAEFMSDTPIVGLYAVCRVYGVSSPAVNNAGFSAAPSSGVTNGYFVHSMPAEISSLVPNDDDDEAMLNGSSSTVFDRDGSLFPRRRPAMSPVVAASRNASSMPFAMAPAIYLTAVVRWTALAAASNFYLVGTGIYRTESTIEYVALHSNALAIGETSTLMLRCSLKRGIILYRRSISNGLRSVTLGRLSVAYAVRRQACLPPRRSVWTRCG